MAAVAIFAVAVLALLAYVDVQSSAVVPVFMYHSFGPGPDSRYETLSVDPKIFEIQMKTLKDNNYNFIGPEKTVAYMTGREKMPPRTVAITADDGYMNFYTVAYPIFKKYKIPAAIFVTTGKIGQKGYLGWNELREMSDSGLITIGSHTRTHPWLPAVSVYEDKLRDELAGSREALEKGLGRPVEYICYPNGGFNDIVRDAAREYGYKGAFTTNPSGRGRLGDIYAIRRIKMSSSTDDTLRILGKATRYYAWFKERR